MENYPANSDKLKRSAPQQPKPKKIEKVIEGDVIRRKKPLGKRFSDIFISGDAQSVWSYVAFDVLIPAAKDAISNAISQGVEKMLFGDVRGPSAGARARVAAPGYTSYNRIGGSPMRSRVDEPMRPRLSARAHATHDFDDIILATKAEAEEVIDQLFELISTYETATVNDLLGMLGQSGNFADEKWGWTDIRGAGATRVKGGYLLDLPRPIPLD